MAVELYTIGHSDHEVGAFIDTLARYGVATVADVRSTPYSRFNPAFNRETLARSLDRRAFSYVFLGAELGARGGDFPDATGAARYRLIAASERFARGLDLLRAVMVESTTALLCAEREPLDCHRTLLISRAVRSTGVAIRHILYDGAVEEHADIERRMVGRAGLAATDLFDTPEEIVERAYDILADMTFVRGNAGEWAPDAADDGHNGENDGFSP